LTNGFDSEFFDFWLIHFLDAVSRFKLQFILHQLMCKQSANAIVIIR